MTTRTFATLDPNAIGPGLALDQGNLIVTTSLNNLDIHRCVHGTEPQAVGDWYFECYFYSQSRVSLAGMVSVGITQPSAALNKYVGEETLSFGFRPADGGIYTNNALVVATSIIPERACIGALLHLSTPGNLQCVWYVDGSQAGYVALPSGKFWLPAVTVSCANAGDVAAVLNFGLHAYENQPSPIV